MTQSESTPSKGFEAHYFEDLAKLEDRHFWFRARNSLILWSLRRYAPGFRNYLEVGCGTGFVLAGVAKAFPNARLVGSEPFAEGLTFAATRVPQAELRQQSTEDLEKTSTFDVVGAFDVLEHIEDDGRALQRLSESVTPGGVLILTVPQHQWLWSPADDYARHERRYSRNDLHKKLSKCGLKIVRSTSFVSFLLPLLLLSRLSARMGKKYDPHAELRVGTISNALLFCILLLEVLLISRGINFFWGGTRFIIARRPSPVERLEPHI